MDRMPPIPPENLTDAQKAAIEQFKATRNADCCTGPWIPLLRSPEAMSRAQAMGYYFRYGTGLAPRLSEFVILLTARHWTQQFEWNVHYPEATRAGVSREVAAAIAEGRRPSGMSDEEETLYDFCVGLQEARRITDRVYSRALAAFGEKGVIDIVGMVGYYTFLAMILNTAQTPAGDAPPGTPDLQ